MTRFKLGRRPRLFSSRVMHLSSIFAARDIAPPPPSVDWTKGISNFGMLCNDEIGDCTAAGYYHQRQIWTANTGTEDSQPAAEAVALYSATGGYVVGDVSTDQGASEQTVLNYLLNTGAPLADGSTAKLSAFFEVDPRNLDDIKTVINECGGCYIGFDVPSGIDESPGATWDVQPDTEIEGGHCVVLVGYDSDKKIFTLISWGALYYMTENFFTQYADEAYALIDPTWSADGNTPLGLTPDQLTAMMDGLK